jgi:hypothetical protein
MFKYALGGVTMANYNGYSEPREYFLGAVGLLAVAAVASALMGSVFGFVMLGVLIGVVCTRAQWARILILVIAAYVGLVGLLIGMFARGTSSFAGFVAAMVCGALWWLLVRPGMGRYFGAPGRSASQVLPVPPKPGALPHLQQYHAAVPRAAAPSAASAGSANTQQQWERLQLQLRAEQESENRETAFESRPARKPFPWLTLVFTVLIYGDAAALAGPVGQFSLLIVVPAFLSAMLNWINPRGVLLAILLLSGALVVVPERAILFSGMHRVLQHQGPVVFGATALLVYVVALCSSGFAGEECENV